MRLAARRAFAFPLVVLLLVSSAGFAGAASAPEAVRSGFQGFRATVLGDVCNIRSSPDLASEVIGQVTQGTPLEILDLRDSWAKVGYRGQEGWIASWLIDIDLRSASVTARITHTDVNLREGPGTEFGVKAVSQKGDVYPAEAKRGLWIRVSLPGGDAAWVSEGLLQLEAEGAGPTLPPPVKYVADDLAVYPAKESLRITENPVTGSTVIGRLSRGESARLIDCEGSWIVVQTTGGARGWVYGPEARVSSTKDPSISLTVSDSSWTIGKYLTVTVTHTDVNFRSGPGKSFPVIAMLTSGDVLRVLESQGEWTKAISPQGVTGWVATWLTGGVSASAGPQFSVVAEAGDMRRILTVTGPFANAIVAPSADGKSVLVSTSSFFQVSATLPVNAYEFAGIKVFGSDVAVSFQEKSTYTVKANVPGKVVMEFAPSVTGVNVQAEANSDVLTIGTLGYALPEVTRSADSITFFLPGASYSGAGAPSGLPAESRVIRSVSVAPRDGGTDVTLKIPGTVPYLLRKASNTIEVRFALPGLSGKKIIVDPGHETEDPGATGPTGLSERNVNWEIAVRLVDLLKKAGADAQLTRPGLYAPTEAPLKWVPAPNEYSGSLAKRAAWSQGADLFISIHNDYNNDRSTAGTASYICERTLNGAESRRFATLVQKELTLAIGTQDKGVKDSDLFVVRESESPAVLIEAMFISNPREESYLRQPATWDKIAAGIARAVQRYFAPGT